MKTDLYKWRCICGENDNNPSNITCKRCSKQRWKQLGFSYMEACNLVTFLFPGLIPNNIF